MLQNIRDKAQGWIAYGIVILISVPFALWGIQEYLGLGSEPVVAKVNGVEITERALDTQFQNFRQQLREQLGGAYRPEMFDDKLLRQEVLNRMIRDELVQQASDKMGLRVNDAEVQAAVIAMPAFQKEGRFDQQAFERAVRQQGMTPAGFMERVRSSLLAQQLNLAVTAGTFVTPYEQAEVERLMNQQREFAYFVVPASDYLVESEISENQITAYYTDHPAEFAVPERVKLRYIHLDVAAAGGTLEVTDEQLGDYYGKNQEKFRTTEQRKASHILILLPENADEAAVAEAKGKIEALRERLTQGADFAELARAESQDPGSAANGGDLGYFGKGVMDPAFEAATFALETGQLSEPVRSSFGFHLIKLEDIRAGGGKPFELAKPEVERAYRKAEGERLYFEMAERLADLSYDDPKSLEPAANELGLKIQESDWVTRDHGVGILGSPKVLAAAFSDDVLNENNNSELIELDNESAIVLRVEEHQEASTQPLDEVKARIVETLRKQKAEAQAQAEAEKRQQEIEGGAPLQQVAGAYAVTGPVSLGRNDRSVPAALSGAVFSSPKPAEGGASSGTVPMGSGDVAVYALYAVKEGTVDQGAGDNLAKSLSRSLERGFYDQLVADLKSRADIEILAKKSEQ